MDIVSAFFGALGGAFLSCMVAVWRRNSEKWKIFQEEIGAIRSDLSTIEKRNGTEGAIAAHNATLHVLIPAVYRVRPYIFSNRTRARLIGLLKDYRAAQGGKESGFIPADMTGNYEDRPGDLFSDPAKAIGYLVGLLDETDRL